MDVGGFLEQLEQLFGLDPGVLNLTSVIEDTPGWSSLTFLGLIALVDERYNVVVTPRQVHKCVTVAELCSLVQGLQVSSVAA